MELVVTGYAGQSGSRTLYLNDETRKKLLDRYPKSFFAVLGEISDPAAADSAVPVPREPDSPFFLLSEKCSPLLSGELPLAPAGKLPPAPAGELPEGIADRESAADGGVFGALWRLLKRNHIGADFSQRAIPILQQTVEICETFGLDPYRMESEECTVWLCEDPSALFDAALKAGIPCERIGFTAKGPGIRRTDGAAVAYLRRPETGTGKQTVGKQTVGKQTVGKQTVGRQEKDTSGTGGKETP